MIPLWILYSLLSAATFSAKDILIKNVFNHHQMTSTHAAMQEYIAYIVFITFLFPFIHVQAFLAHWELFLFKAFTVGSAAYLYFYLLEKHNLSMVAPLLNLSPVILLLFSFTFLGEVTTIKHFIGIFLIVGATYYLQVVLSHHQTKHAHKKHWYQIKRKDAYFFGTVVAMLITVSLTAVVDKILLQEVNWQTNLFFLSFIILFLYSLMKGPKKLVESVKLFKKHPVTIGFVILNTLSTMFVLLAIAIPSALVSLIIPLRRTGTLFTSIFGGLLFHEDHLLKKAISVAFMIVGVVLIVI